MGTDLVPIFLKIQTDEKFGEQTVDDLNMTGELDAYRAARCLHGREKHDRL